MDMNRPFPFPEVLPGENGEDWIIKEMGKQTEGATNLLAKTMIVPLLDEDFARNIRRHELGHAMWSPKVHPQQLAYDLNIGQVTLQKLEDMRIGENLKRVGIDISEGFDPQNQRDKGQVWGYKLNEAASYPDPKMLKSVFSDIIIQMMGEYGTKTYEELLAGMLETAPEKAKEIHPIINQIYKQLTKGNKKNIVDWENLVRTLSLVRKYVVEQPPKSPPPPGAGERPKDGSGGNDGRFDKGALDKLIEELAARGRMGDLPSDFRQRFDGKTRRHQTPEALKNSPWGQMHIEQPELVQNIMQKLEVKKNPRSSDMGDTVRSLHRYMMDGMVFKTKRKVAGGTLLIDASGSMSLSPQQVWLILRAAPAATIAIYGAPEDNSGILRILARDGRMVHNKLVKSPGGGNIIDGPALVWLAANKPPRVWVSDGGVTGIGDSGSGKILRDQANIIMKHGKIIRFHHVEETLEAFAAHFKNRMPLAKHKNAKTSCGRDE